MSGRLLPLPRIRVERKDFTKMNIFTKLINFLKEVKQELAKVSWSSREELIGATIAVIVVTSIMAVYIGIIDLVLSKILSVMFK